VGLSYFKKLPSFVCANAIFWTVVIDNKSIAINKYNRNIFCMGNILFSFVPPILFCLTMDEPENNALTLLFTINYEGN
jgi:hypothetical protein